MLRLGLPIAGLAIGLDQLSKWWIIRLFRPEGVTATPFFTPDRHEITGFFQLVMGWNRGVSFGMFNWPGPWQAIVFSAFSAIVVAVLVNWMRKSTSRLLSVALGMVVGGAIGNAIDRVRFGAVADFLDFHIGASHFPAFNLADSAITVGATLLVLDSLFARRTSSKN